LFPWKSENEKIRMIYGWSPLKIGYITPEKIDIYTETRESVAKFHLLSEQTDIPPFFKYIRGSTNGLYIPEYDETWFICHVVSYEDRRYYYHVFVVLDATTYEPIRFTPMFTFEGEKVEYTLGFVYQEEEEQFIIGYSKMDRSTHYMAVKKATVESMMV